jgi:hypothetical protein
MYEVNQAHRDVGVSCPQRHGDGQHKQKREGVGRVYAIVEVVLKNTK